LNIVKVGFHIQHFIFAYVSPNSNSITPMISISAGSLSDWNELASGKRNNSPYNLNHSFVNCIFEGSSYGYNNY
jgi:hypothetical protein